MRHRKVSRRLSRTTAHRQAMMRNLVTSFLENERVVTTDAKAKELRPLAERMITLGKRGDLPARRQALTIIRRRDVVEKVFSDLKDRYRDRPGGYLRITKLGQRRGDAAPLSVVELLPAGATKAPRKKAARPKTKAAAKAKPSAKPKAKAETTPQITGGAAESPADTVIVEEKPKKKAPAKKKAAAKKKAGDEAAKKKAPAKKKAAESAETEPAKPKKKAAAKKTEDKPAAKKKAPAKKKAAASTEDKPAKPKKKAPAKATKAPQDE